jgi:serine/threonine-protein kinase
LIYPAAQHGGAQMLFARRSDQLEGHAIPGTSGGVGQPLFSPDGEWVAFEADGKEKKVRLDGSAPVTIAEGGAFNGADWTTSGELVVGATGKGHGLSRVSVAGGELAQFTQPDSGKGELDHLWPIGLADGKTIVFTIWSGSLATAQLAMTSLDGGPVSRLDIKGIRPLAVLDDALVYVQADGAVMAVPLGVSNRKVKGKPVPVHNPVAVVSALNGNSAIYVSHGGALVSGLQARGSQLTWLGRDGAARPIGREVRSFSGPRLSPDGRRIAVVLDEQSKRDVWIYDLETGTLSRLTNSGGVTSAEWTRDGARVVYSAAVGAKSAVWAQAVGGATAPTMLLELPDISPYASLSPDGRSVLLQSLVDQRWRVQSVMLDSSHAFRDFNASTGFEITPRFSPDGRWAAFASSESGAFEVYVRSYPEPTVKVQVSAGGGQAHAWSADGTRLYYASGNAIVEARLATTPGLRVLSRDTAFAQVPNGVGDFGQTNFDVSRDGSRIVIPSAESGAYPLVVVPNWLTEFRQRMGAGKGKK